jgi:hypothetical protein
VKDAILQPHHSSIEHFSFGFKKGVLMSSEKVLERTRRVLRRKHYAYRTE